MTHAVSRISARLASTENLDAALDASLAEAGVMAINEIGHVMGIKTVAEHVENQAILSAALDTGVDYMQGFALGKPVPLREIRAHKLR